MAKRQPSIKRLIERDPRDLSDPRISEVHRALILLTEILDSGAIELDWGRSDPPTTKAMTLHLSDDARRELTRQLVTRWALEQDEL